MGTSSNQYESENVTPVLLGTGANAYGLARGFFEEFGVRSVAVSPTTILIPCRNSRFIDARAMPGIDEEGRFVPLLHELAQELKVSNAVRRLLIVACGDTFAALLAHHKHEIQADYLTSTADRPTVDRAVDKVAFWKLCIEAGVGTPLTAVYSYDEFEAGMAVPEPAPFPLVFKAADSVAYMASDFPGRMKAYRVEGPEELNRVASEIYSHGYRGAMLVQEYIPGDDAEMRTLNAYINADGSVAMMCMGHPLLEEYAPDRIGNYAAILSGGDDAVYEQCARLIDALGYTGFINLDMKRDPRDGSYRFFEINPRPGGSSDYTSTAGLNLARWIWNDLVLNRREEPAYCRSEHLWLGVPVCTFKRYAPAGPTKDRALALIEAGRYGRSAISPRDMNAKRFINILRWQLSLMRDYRRFAPQR